MELAGRATEDSGSLLHRENGHGRLLQCLAIISRSGPRNWYSRR